MHTEYVFLPFPLIHVVYISHYIKASWLCSKENKQAIIHHHGSAWVGNSNPPEYTVYNKSDTYLYCLNYIVSYAM